MKYRIISVTPVNYSLNIPEGFSYFKETDIVSAQIKTTVDADIDNNKLMITIYFALFLAKRNTPEETTKAFHVTVNNEYSIQDLKDFVIIEDGEEKLKSDLLTYFNSLSLNHVRGIQSVYTKDTAIAQFLIPSKSNKSKTEKASANEIDN